MPRYDNKSRPAPLCKKPDISLDVDLDPFKDVLEADEEKMNSRIRN
jgi:hypothetical protein